MAKLDEGYSACSALVVEGNPTSRSILVTQLREFGMGTVAQAARPIDARRQLEYRTFDFVLCELHFVSEAMSGQDLLDDLRRNQLLPFSTVFIMITGEATYAKVAEAAESALDGYLLKPHRASHLGERLQQARMRKLSLQDIFTAIENEEFEAAAKLCLERFVTKGKYWLYAARVGAELLLRIGRCTEAQMMYQAVVAAKTLPWAKLGIARAQLDAGQTAQAVTTLESFISEDPKHADAYDIMGRAQFELGRFDKALETYRMAAELTPASLSRLQNLAMMTFYAGDHKEAEKLLGRTARIGIESKMFDCQTLVLLAFTRLELGDRKGLQHCRDDFQRLLEKTRDNPRLVRLSAIVDILHLIQQHQFAQTVEAVRALAKKVSEPDFDFESAGNMLAMLAQMANKAVQLDEVDSIVDAIGMRFSCNRPLSELLAANARVHPPYMERIRACYAKVLENAEVAMSLSMSGDPGAAVKNLILHGRQSLNARLIDNAFQILAKHSAKISDVDSLSTSVNELRSKYGQMFAKATLGEQKRQAGGLALRTGARKTDKEGATAT